MKFDDESIDALASAMGGDEEMATPKGHGIKLDLKWRPALNRSQQKIYDCRAPYVLAYGPRGSGKTQAGLHAMVRHCVNNRNALAVVIVRETGMASEGGCWESLINEILPQWKSGNFDRKTNKRIDKGCGIEHTPPRLDFQDKKSFLFVSNRWGGYSMIKLLSLYVGQAVEDKVKGKTFSFVLCEEAQTFETIDYLTKLGQQVGRRQGIQDRQQIIYTCNPKGPSHWLYNAFMCHGTDEDGKAVECPIDEETGHPVDPKTELPIKDFSVFFVPTQENLHNLVPGYWDRVLLACKNDPIEYARMVEGKWVDKPEGEALFKDAWNDSVHIRGDLNKGKGIIPAKGHPIILGWDPGAAHTAITLQQYIPTPEKIYWLWFDEINCVGKYMPYRRLVPMVIQRMQYWERIVSEKEGSEVEFRFIHISDNSAFNQFRARDGSFDAQDIEDISKEYCEREKLPDRFIIRMKECPKGPHSVEARVRIGTDLLMDQSLILSATCVHGRAMFMHLEAERDNRMKPKRSRHLHSFDSWTYPPLYFTSGIGRLATKPTEDKMPLEFYRVGG